MKEEITCDNQFHSYSINTGKNYDLGCYKKVLQKIEDTLNTMLKYHSKIMVVRFDIRFPYSISIEKYSEFVSDFDYNLKRKLKRERIIGGHRVDAKTIYVEEQKTGEHPHYHFVVIVNANAKNKYYDIMQTTNELWMKTVNSYETGLVDYCNNYKNGIIIDRNSDNFNASYNEVFYQLSYLAKVQSKENRNKGSWLVKGSR